MTVSNGAGDNGLLLKAVFWDMDGTLIDSEPYWHEGELKIAAEHGGYWDEDLAWQGSGTPVPDVARRMVEHGCQLSIEEFVGCRRCAVNVGDDVASSSCAESGRSGAGRSVCRIRVRR